MNTPAFDPDDPRLTAYALDEATPAERAETERLLATSPEARAAVEQTAALARALEDEFRRENEAYWEARRGKIVEFPAPRRVGWKPAAAVAWKIAAVVVALGVLLHLALQRKTPPNATVASSHPIEPAKSLATAAPPPMEEARTAEIVAQASAPSAAQPEASPAEAAKPLLAMESGRAPRADAMAATAAPPVALPSSRGEASRTAPRSSAGANADASITPGAEAGGGKISPMDRAARSLVVIHTAAGKYVGGVLVTADGWILAARPLSADETHPIVMLTRRGGTFTTSVRAKSEAGLTRLRIEGTNLPAVTLAGTAPADQTALTFASTDGQTGATRFLRARASVAGAETRVQWDGQPPTDVETGLVFNADGELLMLTNGQPTAKADARARAAFDHAEPTWPVVRPFTADERALLQPTTQTRAH